ncbi:ankyrin, partial [Coprinopsis marcescibilis]
EIAEMAKWLTKINYQAIQLDTFSKREPNTASWVLGIEEFKFWFWSDGGLLWGTGIPGAGKTILSSVVIHNFQQLAKSQQHSTICVLFAYCRYTDQIPVKEILAALIRQLLERYPATFQLIRAMYNRHHRENTHPPESELFELLKEIADSKIFSKIYCILDGLDEAASSVHQVDILEYMVSLKVNFFITSRPLAALKKYVPHAVWFDIITKDGDIETLVVQRVAKSPVLSELLEDEELKKEVVTMIKDASSGMFLLASLQLDLLRDCLSVSELKEALHDLPRRLDEMYKGTMDRVEQQPRGSLAKRVLLWLLYTQRSLTLDELRYAVATSPGTETFDKGRLVSKDAILGICCGLVSLDEQSGLVRLIHYTAMDFLKPILEPQFPDPHLLLASACVTRLQQFNLHDQCFASFEELALSKFIDHPFLAYPHQYWTSHIRYSHSGGTSTTIMDFVKKCRRYPFVTDDLAYTMDHFAHVHLLAMEGLIEMLQRLILEEGDEGEGGLVNWRTEMGATPLMLAAGSGKVDVVLYLLTFRVEVDATDEDGWTALAYASHNGHATVVEALVSQEGINVNKATASGNFPLGFACLRGHADVVKVLLATKGIEVNKRDVTGATAFIMAAGKDQTQILRMLLDVQGVDVN